MCVQLYEFDKCLQSSNQYYNQNKDYLHHFKKFFWAPVVTSLTLYSQALANGGLISVPIVVLFPECYVNGIMQYQPLSLVSLALWNTLEIHPCVCTYQWPVPLHCCVVSYCVNVLRFVYISPVNVCFWFGQ